MYNLEVLTFLNQHIDTGEPFILACSTGADSMYLLYHILQTPHLHNMTALYFHHQTREQCDEEVIFLQDLGKTHGFDVQIGTANIHALRLTSPSVSFEELARHVRYDFFQDIAHKKNIQKIFLGHHLDDRIETMLFHMLRGSKLPGLINMRAVSPPYYRPLLHISKQHIQHTLDTHNMGYYEDSTNNERICTRNIIRQQVTPVFESVHPQYRTHIDHLLHYFEQTLTYINHDVEVFLQQYEKNYFLQTDFIQLHIFLQKEIIRYIYVQTNQGTHGLSNANIEECIRYIYSKNNKTHKTIHKLTLSRENNNIWYTSDA